MNQTLTELAKYLGSTFIGAPLTQERADNLSKKIFSLDAPRADLVSELDSLILTSSFAPDAKNITAIELITTPAKVEDNREFSISLTLESYKQKAKDPLADLLGLLKVTDPKPVTAPDDLDTIGMAISMIIDISDNEHLREYIPALKKKFLNPYLK